MNPYLLQPPALISFSGGRTSAFMLRNVLDAHGGALPDGVHVTFANTGKERTETLDFVQECSTRWGCPVEWLEYRHVGGDHTYATVDYATAARDGEPFEALIRARSFLPNPVMRFCTQELKVRVMKKFMLDRGYDEWDVAIGLRADEPVRVHRASLSTARERWRNVTPLATAGVTLTDVTEFWRAQPFDLGLRQDEGNCDLCFLKGAAKLERLILERPGSVGWWDKQEVDQGGTFRNDRPRYSVMLKQVQEQGRLPFEDHEYDVCHCTD